LLNNVAVLDYAHGKKNSEVSEEQYLKLTQALVFRRQYLLYLDAVMQETNEAQQHLNQLQFKHDEALKELKYSCKSKSAVPVDQVYPLFITLAATWYTWFDELFMISFKRGIMETLQGSSKLLQQFG
jgi:hypothetical protein